MLELCLREYAFVITDGAYLCHSAPSRFDDPYQRLVARARQTKNTYYYADLILSFSKKYTYKESCTMLSFARQYAKRYSALIAKLRPSPGYYRNSVRKMTSSRIYPFHSSLSTSRYYPGLGRL